MQNYVGSVLEFRLETDGQKTARISCPDKAIPAPGQYLLAHSPEDSEASLESALFQTKQAAHSFIAAPPIPAGWQLGATLHLRGPLGKGFHLPSIRNLALAPLNGVPGRLLPLIQHADNTALFLPSPSPLFSSSPVPSLPTSIEINLLEDLPAALQWADFLALDIPLERLSELPQILGLTDNRTLPCPAQALILTPMPCGGIADCGVCAVPTGRKYQLACKDGPVFELKTLLGKQRCL
jgi:hypothetical protein